MTFPIGLGQRGQGMFSPEELRRIIATTVEPEMDDKHTVTGVGAITSDGIKAALVFRRHTTFGEWRLEAAFEHDWPGDNKVAGQILFKL